MTPKERLGAAAGAGGGRIRVLQFVTNFHFGGTEGQVAALQRSLDASRFDPRMACLRRSGELLDEMEAGGVPIDEYALGGRRCWSLVREQLRFVRRLRRTGVQIVHTHGFYPDLFGAWAAKAAGVPVVVASIRDMGDMLSPLQRRALRCACRAADSIIVNAEAVRNRLMTEGYRAEKVSVIKNGVDLRRFPETGVDGRLHRELGLPADTPLVVVLCRLYRHRGIDRKGVGTFLDAAARVGARFPQARFLVVGDGHGRQKLEERATELGIRDRVLFLGFRLDVPELLSEAVVSVSPSLGEALSNTVLESMAAGLPVVATRVGGTPEVVEEGVTGLLVPPRDAGALAEAISCLLRDPWRASDFGRAGRRRVRDCFSLERMVRETEALYQGLWEKAIRTRGGMRLVARWGRA